LRLLGSCFPLWHGDGHGEDHDHGSDVTSSTHALDAASDVAAVAWIGAALAAATVPVILVDRARSATRVSVSG
jgi:hypothetical protein